MRLVNGKIDGLAKFVETILYPEWMQEFVQAHENWSSTDLVEMMQIANELARLNVVNETGGPFGSIIMDYKTGRIVGYGVNRVVSYGSIWHGEISAIQDALRRTKLFTLSEGDYALVTSSTMCAMCAGAVIWAGVKHVVTGATREDVEAINFDEGPIHPEFEQEFIKRGGVSFTKEILREECISTLQLYAKKSGIIYNGTATCEK